MNIIQTKVKGKGCKQKIIAANVMGGTLSLVCYPNVTLIDSHKRAACALAKRMEWEGELIGGYFSNDSMMWTYALKSLRTIIHTRS